MRKLFFLLLLATMLPMLSLAADNISLVNYSGKQYYKYEVQPKETIYGLSKRFGVTQDELIANNPFLADGLKIGQVLLIPKVVELKDVPPYTPPVTSVQSPAVSVSSSRDKTEVNTVPAPQTAETEKTEETAYEVPAGDYRTADDGHTRVRLGHTVEPPLLEIPVVEEVKDTVFSLTLTRPDADPDHTTHFAILLPFLLNSNGNQATQRYIEFYESILLTASQLKAMGYSIRFDVYDIGVSLFGLRSALKEFSLKNCDFVIAAPNTEQLPELSQWAMDNRVNLVLPFSSRVAQTASNPYIFQVMPPYSLVYERLLDRDFSSLSGKNILLVRCSDTDTEGNEYKLFQGLRQKLDDNGIHYQMITESSATASNLNAKISNSLSTSKENLIFPAPMQNNTFNRLVTLIGVAANAVPAARISLWGYPDWVAGKSSLSQLYALNTQLYSTFYADFSSDEVQDYMKLYAYTYGKDMLSTYPRYALMGHDILIYFTELATGCETGLPMLQNAMDFHRLDKQSGWYNHNIYMIHYSPDRHIEAELFSKEDSF